MAIDVTKETLLTAEEAAEKMRLETETVKKLIRLGKLESVKSEPHRKGAGNRTIRTSVEAIARYFGQTPSPPKVKAKTKTNNKARREFHGV